MSSQPGESTQGKLRGVWGRGEAEVGYAEAGSDSSSEEVTFLMKITVTVFGRSC